MSIFDFGRRFVNSLPIVGGVTSGLWGDPGQEDMQKAMAQAQEQMKLKRQFDMEGRMNAMNQGALAFGPRNQMLGQMMGQQGPAMDLNPMLQNPMGQAQQNDIRSAAFGAPPPNDGRSVGGVFTQQPPPMNQQPPRRY